MDLNTKLFDNGHKQNLNIILWVHSVVYLYRSTYFFISYVHFFSLTLFNLSVLLLCDLPGYFLLRALPLFVILSSRPLHPSPFSCYFFFVCGYCCFFLLCWALDFLFLSCVCVSLERFNFLHRWLRQNIWKAIYRESALIL